MRQTTESTINVGVYIMANTNHSRHITSLWLLIEGLQKQLEHCGVDRENADAKVIAKVVATVRRSAASFA